MQYLFNVQLEILVLAFLAAFSLRVVLWRFLVLAAAWWYEFVDGSSVWIAHWPASFCHALLPRYACRVDRLVQRFVQYLLFDWLAWLVAGDFLLAKWRDESASRDASISVGGL